MYGEPIMVKGTGEEELESKRRELTDALNLAMTRADELFSNKPSLKGEPCIILYNILLVLLTIMLSPVMLFKLVTVPKYRGGISQKLGRVRKRVKRVIGTTRPIWVHAVSVGEVMAAHPLIRELKKKYPGTKLILSTVTVTGNYTAIQRVPEADAVFFFPFRLSLDRAQGHPQDQSCSSCSWPKPSSGRIFSGS